ncbi:MAG: hypothetical protein IKD89_04685 [Clostridia bacterium]|nr:hypothetical protein [Clostridia bacterium]
MKLDHADVLELLFQRYPFLWVDEVTDCEAGKYAVSKKYMDPDFPMFKGYSPDCAAVPGTILIEAMSQTAGVATALYYKEKRIKAPIRLFAGIENARFYKRVPAGVTITVKSVLRDPEARFIYADCEVLAMGERVASAVVSFVFAKPLD